MKILISNVLKLTSRTSRVGSVLLLVWSSGFGVTKKIIGKKSKLNNTNTSKREWIYLFIICILRKQSKFLQMHVVIPITIHSIM